MQIGALKKILDSVWKNSVLVFLCSLIIFILGTGRSSIYIYDESKNAQCAWEMLNSDDHITPVFNGELRIDKPPLHYYFMMFSYTLMGKNGFAARFFSSVSGALLMSVLFLFVSTYAGRTAAFWTILVLLSSILWVFEFHLAVPDPYLIMFTSAGLMAFFHFTERGKRWTLPLMYVCFSLGFMAKGPVAIGLPGLAIIIFLIVTRSFKWAVIKSMQPLTGLLIFLLVAVPWYLLVWRTTDGEWIKGFFLDHNIKRFTNVKEGHGGIFLITLAYFAIGLLPFFVFIGGVSRYIWKQRHSKIVVFSLVIILVFIVFFSISRTKLPNYAMPSFTFAAILIGLYLDRLARGEIREKLNLRVGLWILFFVSVSIPIGLTFGVVFEPLISHIKTLGLPFIILPAGVLISLRCINRQKYRKAMLTLSFAFILGSVVFHCYLIPKIDSCNPVSANLELLQNSDSVRYYRRIYPSFIFNYGVIDEIKDTASVRSFLLKGGNILITSKKAVQQIPAFWQNYSIVYSEKDLFDSNHTMIFSSKDE